MLDFVSHSNILLPAFLFPEKRKSFRVRFPDPLDAMLSKRNVRLMDLSTTGARVEHAFPLSLRKRARFEFLCNGDPLSLQAEVVRSRLAQVSGHERVFCSGLRFVEEEDHELWGLIVSMAMERLREK